MRTDETQSDTPSTASTIACFVLPASVKIAVFGAQAAASAVCAAMRSTGVQNTTKSAWRTASAISNVASSMAPSRRACFEIGGIAADADDAPGEAAFFRCQADGAADQADADNHEGV